MATQNLKSYSYSTESLKKIIFLATVCLITVVGLLYSFFLLGSLGDNNPRDIQQINYKPASEVWGTGQLPGGDSFKLQKQIIGGS